MTSTVFVELESPAEGPTVVEGITHGTIYLNPRFDPPKTLPGFKPTDRKLTSQTAFTEIFVGERKYVTRVADFIIYSSTKTFFYF